MVCQVVVGKVGRGGNSAFALLLLIGISAHDFQFVNALPVFVPGEGSLKLVALPAFGADGAKAVGVETGYGGGRAEEVLARVDDVG